MSLLGNLAAAVTILGHHLEAAIQRLQIRNSQIRGRSLGKSQGEIRLNCLNCPELTWVETTDNLMEAASGGVVGVPLDAQQLLKIAETLQTTNALSLIEIVEGLDLDSACDDRFLARVSEQLLVNMPVMSVSKGGFIVIVNMHEFLFSGQRDSFADLLLLDTPVDSEADNKEDTEGEEPQVVHHVHLKPGRKPLSEQFPEIVTLVTDYSQTWELRPPKGLGVSGPIFQVVSFARFGSKIFNMELYTCPCASHDISDRWLPHVSGGVIGNDHDKRSLQTR